MTVPTEIYYATHVFSPITSNQLYYTQLLIIFNFVTIKIECVSTASQQGLAALG